MPEYISRIFPKGTSKPADISDYCQILFLKIRWGVGESAVCYLDGVVNNEMWRIQMKFFV